MTELKTARELAEVYVKRFHDMRDCSAEYQIKEMLILIEAMREACVEQIVSIPLGPKPTASAEIEALRAALQESADQLDAMNQSPSHAASWIYPRSTATQERVSKYRALLSRKPEQGRRDDGRAE